MRQRLVEPGEARGAADVDNLVDVVQVEARGGHELLHLLVHAVVDRADLHVEPEAGDRAREVEAVLERLDGARRRAGRRGDGALRVLEREPELRLCTLVLRVARGADRERRLGLFRELLREVLDQPIIDCVAADSVVGERGEREREALADGEEGDGQRGGTEIDEELRAVSAEALGGRS